jgi:predicted DsbA family dithiol-disulfide isomerase
MVLWQMHDRLLENQERLGEALFLDLDEELKLSTTAMRQALEQRTFEARVRADFKGGVRSGVNGTPTFFIDGHRHDGSFDFETLVSAIHQAMERRKASRGRQSSHIFGNPWGSCSATPLRHSFQGCPVSESLL